MDQRGSTVGVAEIPAASSVRAASSALTVSVPEDFVGGLNCPGLLTALFAPTTGVMVVRAARWSGWQPCQKGIRRMEHPMARGLMVERDLPVRLHRSMRDAVTVQHGYTYQTERRANGGDVTQHVSHAAGMSTISARCTTFSWTDITVSGLQGRSLSTAASAGNDSPVGQRRGHRLGC